MGGCRRQAIDSYYFPSQPTCSLNTSAGIRKWWESGLEFDLDAVDSSHIAEIVGIPVELAFVVWGFAVSALTDAAMTVVSSDAVYAGLRLHPTAQA